MHTWCFNNLINYSFFKLRNRFNNIGKSFTVGYFKILTSKIFQRLSGNYLWESCALLIKLSKILFIEEKI